MPTYYISDLHFGHANILSFDNRPFRDIRQHDAALISNWNRVVNPDDTVWVLGDISWYPAGPTTEIFKNLNGEKRLIMGNHDKKLVNDPGLRSQFAEIAEYKEIVDGNTCVVLCHYPIPCFKNHYYNWVHLYGHVHNSFEWNMMRRVRYEMEELYTKPCRMYNVGCMIEGIDYTPRTLEQAMNSLGNSLAAQTTR